VQSFSYIFLCLVQMSQKSATQYHGSNCLSTDSIGHLGIFTHFYRQPGRLPQLSIVSGVLHFLVGKIATMFSIGTVLVHHILGESLCSTKNAVSTVFFKVGTKVAPAVYSLVHSSNIHSQQLAKDTMEWGLHRRQQQLFRKISSVPSLSYAQHHEF
jgi:uncharacterized membrane protein YfcA